MALPFSRGKIVMRHRTTTCDCLRWRKTTARAKRLAVMPELLNQQQQASRKAGRQWAELTVITDAGWWMYDEWWIAIRLWLKRTLDGVMKTHASHFLLNCSSRKLMLPAPWHGRRNLHGLCSLALFFFSVSVYAYGCVDAWILSQWKCHADSDSYITHLLNGQKLLPLFLLLNLLPVECVLCCA